MRAGKLFPAINSFRILRERMPLYLREIVV